MSTKTIYKRIALVAVAGLGAGLLSVAPANAASSVGDVYFGATGTVTASTSVAVGTETAVAITVAHTSDVTPSPVTLTPTLLKPAASSAAVTDVYLNYTLAAGTNQTAAGQVPNTTTGAIVATSAATAATATVFAPVIKFKPDVPGIYTLSFALTGAGIAGGARSLTGVLTVFAGKSLDATRANTAFPIQGSNITTGWAATNPGQASVRLTNFSTDTTKKYYVSATGASIASFTEQETGADTLTAFTNSNNTNLADGFNFVSTSSQISDAVDVTITPATGATTAAVTVKFFDATTGAETIFSVATVTWGVAAAASAQYSLLTLNAGAGLTATGSAADTTATTVARTAGTKQFTIQTVVKDQYDVAINGLTLLASISGPGSLGIGATTASSATLAGRSLSVALTGANLGHVTVFGDGTSGVATVTISVTNALGVSTVLGTKSVTFVGSPATVTVTQNLKIAQAATRLGLVPTTSRVAATTAATTPAFRASVVDANGVAVVSGSTVKMTSSDETVIVPGVCAEYTTTGSSTATVPAPGTFECSVSGANAAVSGKTATITLSVLNAATGLYSIVATPITFAIGGAIASTVVAVNKTSFLPGEAIVMTATAKDSAGNAAYDGQNPYATVATGNMTVGGAFPATTAFIVGGVHSTTVAGVNSLFAPASAGTLTVTGLTAATAAAPAGAAFTASVTVSSSADISALTTLINSLIAKINALNKLVIKIQKKVKAK